MDRTKDRKTWIQSDSKGEYPVVPAIKEEILPQYEEYLLLLQERNRLLTQLRQKNKQQVQLERKEKGFSIYVNGANIDLPANSSLRLAAGLKTATGKSGDQTKKRAKTAPARERRRNWNVSSVDIATNDGQKKVKAPEILSGKYEEDFEEINIDEDVDDIEDVGNSVSSSSSLHTPRRQKTSYLKRKVASLRENTMTITVADVHKLRQSLETNAHIRQSVIMDISSSSSLSCRGNDVNESEHTFSSEDEIPEDIEMFKEDSESDHEPPIDEDCEIEEDLEPAMESIKFSRGNKKSLKPNLGPGDTIVLEFAPSSDNKSRIEKSLMAVRKKESVEGISSSSLYSSALSKPPMLESKSSHKSGATRDMNHINTAPRVKTLVSAKRHSSGSKEDSAEEALAVIKAMKEENQEAAHFAKSARPLPLPGSKSRQLAPPIKSSSQECVIDNKQDSDHISVIVKRVLEMAPKQQRGLLKMLSKIDDSLTEANGSGFNKPLDSKEKGGKVTIEMVSNWGHPSRLGLTEIQLLNELEHLLPVSSSGVFVHGAETMSGSPSILFNGKTKTTKERNMWSCRWTGRPIVLCIEVGNVKGQQSQLSALRIWNWNKSIQELDAGVRQVRVFVGDELVFDGDVDKGCGNHVFDYSKTIQFSDKLTSKRLESPSSFSAKSMSSKDRSPTRTNVSIPPPFPATSYSLSNWGLPSPLKGDNPSVPNDGHHHTFRSISRSSASSASSSGSHPSRPSSQNDEKGRQTRSETRTLGRPSQIMRQNTWDTDHSSPENEHQDTENDNVPERISNTPCFSKHISGRLSGKSSDSDTSRSNTDSCEQKPPLPPDKSLQKSADKMARSTEKLAPKASKSEPLKSPRAAPVLSVKSSLSGQDLRHEEDKLEAPIVEQLKNMGLRESKRKKDIPRWLTSGEAVEVKTDNLNERSTTKIRKQNNTKAAAKPEEDEDIQSLLDEEFAKFSDPKAGLLPNKTLKKSKLPPSSCPEEDDDTVSPMKRIEKSRSKWRSKQSENIEETWGSLSFFNKSHRGRLSIDMTDDILDEYLAPAKKSEISPLPIPEDGFTDDDESFVIPELPTGQELVINILSTWGDKHYVGLTTIQVFASTGEQVQIKKIHADPPDINILPEYDRDPRVVTNLLDGVSRTRDDTHMWLTPFTPGKNHFIFITFAKSYNVALIRIWNYNKSRIHSYRGAKDIVMTLDKTVIFKGEIARACGGTEGGTEAFGDTILFTTDEEVLDAVSRNDDAFEGDMLSEGEEDIPLQRPRTADNEESDEMRPFTRAAGQLEKKEKTPSGMVTFAGDILVYKTHKLELNFTATWGDLHYLGLTALEVVGKDGEALPLNMSVLSAQPRDIRHLKGHERDDRTLDKLIDGTCITTSDEHMWLVPFTEGQNHTVTVTFPQETLVSGLRIWNYNKTPEDTFRGARIMHVSINERWISPEEGFLVRKGPGNCHFDFAQEINFTRNPEVPSQGNQNTNDEGEPMQMPCGFIYQLHLFSTWGDPYYIGLNGLEFYDTFFKKIILTESNIAAHPNSVNVLEQVHNDVRTPDKLIDGENDTMDGRHMWLAPILPGVMNRVYIIFDQPTTVSMIKIWNYSKTPQRGVKDFALLVDDLLVYNGTLQAVKSTASGILPTCSGPQQYHTILFTGNADVLRREKYTVINNQAEDQDVQLLNDKKIVTKHADPNKANSGKPVNQALRPKTSVIEVNKRTR
ncbi:protein KIAA0556 homolog isoform X2 [Pomacea canaliculata]|uniref:protein KIAA0556 homolog isoform X2 n=1 Tax=Pomacea canaliculata TaxID=400727 RepID=UPI000D73E638|nr:protein KIAA0556 homolog isoform X2 [Pomacea canaliculata]